MGFADTLNLWIHYCEILSNPSLANRHRNAKSALWAIEDYWVQRRQLHDCDEFFIWPTTNAPLGGGEFHVDWPSAYGVLRLMGYQVGRVNGKRELVRRGVLHRVYKIRLPPVLPGADLDSWGAPDTGPRLQKMAESIAAFARNAKRNDPSKLKRAIDEWEADLEYLRQKYYVDKYDFPYPQIEDAER
jgi:hypothetical protein